MAISRRVRAAVWAFLAAWMLASALTAPARGDTGAREIVLIHGSFVGGWYWDGVRDGLRARGHSVQAIDLTGHGDRPVTEMATVTLDRHIADVVAAIDAAGAPVVLVAHSYGGRPATGAWDAARDRIAAVIFLEAVAPYGSGPLALPEETIQKNALAAARPEALRAGVLDPPPDLAERYPGKPLVPQSLAALYAPVPLTRGPLPDTPGAYVIGTHSTARIFRSYAGRVSEERGWTIWEIATGHDMAHDDADLVARLIDKLARELPRD